ncbi:DJ-1/PfpI family protein [Allostreptomyces psammosilenae]|uniref:Putative intracellular protease/amidase n=1 Tax=Allostreptomyces psammosilenae TaxID=1892865 RepID=A0A852ZU98_9ACTN|nr:DJ-1/PfpI family protein [Allostreptomyces psammosilenae]NYI05879.1 putative intracellular protease/amidase [Allostreptomyces psammosilenae]
MTGARRSRRDVVRAATAGGVGVAMAAVGAAPARAKSTGATEPTEATAAAQAAGSPADRPHGLLAAVLLYDGFTALDAVGPYEVLCRLPGLTVTTVAERTGPIRTDTGELGLVADRRIADVRHADILIIPGGGNRGTVATMNNAAVQAWVRRVHERTRWTATVCTGSLILGAGGLLRGLPATTYWASREYLERELGAVYTPGRFVEAGRIITAAGVSAGIDMGLHLAARLAGEDVARALQLGVEYDPHPPFDSGSPEKAGPDIQRLALELIDAAAV